MHEIITLRRFDIIGNITIVKLAGVVYHAVPVWYDILFLES